jgi:hypothetical protein
MKKVRAFSGALKTAFEKCAPGRGFSRDFKVVEFLGRLKELDRFDKQYFFKNQNFMILRG